MAKGARNRALSQLAAHETRGLPKSFTKSIARKLRKQLYKTKYTDAKVITPSGHRIPPTLSKHKSMQGYRRTMRKSSTRQALHSLAKTAPETRWQRYQPYIIAVSFALLILTIIALVVLR